MMTIDTTRCFSFEGREISIQTGDTIASALYRDGVRTFSRSFKYHRRRGLYCLTGDCPNCLVNVDGESCVRACTTPAHGGARVRRENGWPSVEHDLLRVADFARFLLPVGFYYKTFRRPRVLWPLVEPLLRRIAGRGSVPGVEERARRPVRHVHVDTLVVGGGSAGLEAAIGAAEKGERVLLCEEGKFAERIAPGPARDVVLELAAVAASQPLVSLHERAPALGIYEGPLVPVDAEDELILAHPRRVVVATGAVELHGVFPGNDLPGVFLGRGAARLAGCHAIRPGRVAVIAAETREGCEHVRTLRDGGVSISAVLVPAMLCHLIPDGVRTIPGGKVVRAGGRGHVTHVVVDDDGEVERIACDTLVLSLGFEPRDVLLRQAHGLPVVGVGDVVIAGRAADSTLGGVVCLCEDVSRGDLELAWHEGFGATELLKRYTTVGMGPCQGALCQAHLSAFVAQRVGDQAPTAQRTTARPPARTVTLERIAAAGREMVEQRTRLDARHQALGVKMEPAGTWRRPAEYGDVEAEYRAVREAVSVMDVSTLGKYLIGGTDATEFLDRLYPCRIRDLAPGRVRYGLLLAESGYVIDDGIICALDGSSWYVTFTSGGADRIEAWLHDWAETWCLDVHIVSRTAAVGAINVAGPRARELLRSLSSSPFENEDFPYLNHRDVEVAGVPCRAIRLGFVGELSYELHHPSSRSVELWDALLDAGVAFGTRPHGLEALRLLRLEKGHVIIDQDTDYDSTPARLNMEWAVCMEKPSFLGKAALERMVGRELRKRLVSLRFDAGAPPEGAPVTVDGRYAGYLTSSRFSPVLAHGVALGWLYCDGNSVPEAVESLGLTGTVLERIPYDADGVRLRA